MGLLGVIMRAVGLTTGIAVLENILDIEYKVVRRGGGKQML
jgi:hypothetical protein